MGEEARRVSTCFYCGRSSFFLYLEYSAICILLLRIAYFDFCGKNLDFLLLLLFKFSAISFQLVMLKTLTFDSINGSAYSVRTRARNIL